MNRLWALDYGSDGKGQPKIFIFDLSNDELVLKYNFPKGIAGMGSQLNGLVFLFFFFFLNKFMK